MCLADLASVGRGASAPMLFNPSKSRAIRRRKLFAGKQRDAAGNRGDDSDLQSINGEEDDESELVRSRFTAAIRLEYGWMCG